MIRRGSTKRLSSQSHEGDEEMGPDLGEQKCRKAPFSGTTERTVRASDWPAFLYSLARSSVYPYLNHQTFNHFLFNSEDWASMYLRKVGSQPHDYAAQ
jgi:hypothetical protein